MEAYQERVVEELMQLTERYEKLRVFLESEKFNDVVKEEQHRMHMQLQAMGTYKTILEQRVGYFGYFGYFVYFESLNK